MLITGMAEADIRFIIKGIGNVVFLILSLISAVMTILGPLRKVRLHRWSADQ